MATRRVPAAQGQRNAQTVASGDATPASAPRVAWQGGTHSQFDRAEVASVARGVAERYRNQQPPERGMVCDRAVAPRNPSATVSPAAVAVCVTYSPQVSVVAVPALVLISAPMLLASRTSGVAAGVGASRGHLLAAVMATASRLANSCETPCWRHRTRPLSTPQRGMATMLRPRATGVVPPAETGALNLITGPGRARARIRV